MRDWDRTYREKGMTQYGLLPTVQLSAKILKENACSKVLDLGCGSGRHTMFLARSGFKVYGVDKSPHAIHITANHMRQRSLQNVFLTVADMHTLPYGTGKFDAIVCVWSIGHGYRKDIVRSVEEMSRVLSPDGILLADFPSTKDRNWGQGMALEENTFLHPFLDHPDVPHHYLTKDSLSDLLKEHFVSFSIQEITYDDPKYNSAIEAFWVQARRPRQAIEQLRDTNVNLG